MSSYSHINEAFSTLDAHIKWLERQNADLLEALRLAEEKVGVAEAIRRRARLWDALVANLKSTRDHATGIHTFSTGISFSYKVSESEMVSALCPDTIEARVRERLDKLLGEWSDKVLEG